MNEVLKFVIPGSPKPKQSARFRITKGRGGQQFIHSYQTKEVQDEERSIRLIIKEQLPKDFEILRDGVKINKLHYVFPPLSSHSKKILAQIEAGVLVYKTTKPDLDSNLNKGLFDAMEGIVFLNDSQVCEINNLKKYYGFEPRTEIEISLLNNDSRVFMVHKTADLFK